jgi:hypothetical protein
VRPTVVAVDAEVCDDERLTGWVKLLPACVQVIRLCVGVASDVVDRQHVGNGLTQTRPCETVRERLDGQDSACRSLHAEHVKRLHV